MFKNLKNLFTRKAESKPIESKKTEVKQPIEIVLTVKYNWQLNNSKIGTISASSQCGYTVLAMLLFDKFFPLIDQSSLSASNNTKK